MIDVYRSQWLLLNRFRMWAIAGLVTVAFTIVATAVGTATAESAFQSDGAGLTLEALAGPGGATAGVIWALAFGSILLLASFISAAGNEFTRGTFRTALLQRPGRWSFFTGKMAALMTVTVVLMVVALVVGWITAGLIAPGQDVDTNGWIGMEAAGAALGDLLRLVGWAFGWAVIGTTIGVLCRSTPIALGVGLVWFGPIENVIGDGADWAQRWFPGLLLRAIVAPDSPGAVSTTTAVVTLAAYLVVFVAVLGAVLARRDVTS